MGDLAPMQMLEGYRSAPDRAAWMQQNQTPAQPVQPWQPPQRTYSQPEQSTGMMKGIAPQIERSTPFGINADRAGNSITYQVLNNQRQQGAK